MSPAWKTFLRSAGAILIALAFISMLMTASAQQEVVKQLTVIDPKLDYSSAYVVKLQVDQSDSDARLAQSNELAANLALIKTSGAFESAKSDFDDAWEALAPLIRSSAVKCGIEAKAADDSDPGRRWQTIGAMQACVDGGNLAPAQRTQLKSALDPSGGVVAAYHILAAAKGQLTNAQGQLARAQTRSRTLSAQDARAKQIRDSFDATSKLRSSWYLGGDLLIDFPPALLQIILSFVSGAFGALLLTLVLIVYPNSQFTITSNGGYGARTLLGGLIALCVYVVLNGGSAVLGTTAAAASGTSNYMAFCAIGILAGMFSDRVAAWLSARADAFFRSG